MANGDRLRNVALESRKLRGRMLVLSCQKASCPNRLLLQLPSTRTSVSETWQESLSEASQVTS